MLYVQFCFPIDQNELQGASESNFDGLGVVISLLWSFFITMENSGKLISSYPQCSLINL